MNIEIIEITAGAKDKILAIQKAQDNSNEPFLRIGSRGGGCGVAISYFLGFDQKEADDQLLTVNGIDLVINKGQLLQLQGLKVEWVESDSEQGFKFTEPGNPPIAAN